MGGRVVRKGSRDEEGGRKGYLGDFKGGLDEGLEARLVVVDLGMVLRIKGWTPSPTFLVATVGLLPLK